MFRILTYSFIVVLLGLVVGGSSCSSTEEKKEGRATESVTPETYRADNDIAMTVRSLADALSQGEPLDSADYNFEGVLTDGQGYPLYTDIQGGPGVWEVLVLSPRSAVVRNLYLGDLFPDDLGNYVISALGLSPDSEIQSHEYDDDEMTSVRLYSFNGGELRIESRSAVAPNGLEGPLVSIILTATPDSLRSAS